jgi:hypothetical protein
MQNTLKNSLSITIIEAFTSVSKPTVVAPHQCPECKELTQDFLAYSGNTLPDEIFDKHVWDMPLLSDDAKHFYISAWLLRAYLGESWSDACDSLTYSLIDNHRWNSTQPYTDEQWRVIDIVLQEASKFSDPITIENINKARSRTLRTTE